MLALAMQKNEDEAVAEEERSTTSATTRLPVKSKPK